MLLGFDFPIGLPMRYAQRVQTSQFMDILALFGSGSWKDFYQPAMSEQEIDLHRPFYPMLPGGARRSRLAEGLQIPFDDLYRQCDRARPNRRAACPLFWTLGGQQVGKAAIAGWREILQPALDDPLTKPLIWPFAGWLKDLLQPGILVVAETYPAEFYRHLGIEFSHPMKGRKSGKRSQSDRAANANRLLEYSSKWNIHLEAALVELIQDGFGRKASGEDPFDAVVGLWGMIEALDHWGADYEPQEAAVRQIEGWIFGMPAEFETKSEPGT
jgi:hypothetical protein